MKKILILTSKTGGGHESIAQAVKQALQSRFQVQAYDAVPLTAAKVYAFVHLYLPTAFNLIYRLSDNPLLAKILHFLSLPLTLKSLRKIPFEKYDLIVSVQAFFTKEISWLTNQPLVIVICDPLSIHQAWINPQAKLHFVATQEGRQVCLKKGLKPKQIIVSGFPVRQEFFQEMPKQTALRQKLGLNPHQFTILLGGSGYGVRETKATLKYLKDLPIQILVVCGRNWFLKKTLSQQPNIKAFGFVKNMPELIKAADLVVGKAGPNLLFESVALEVPFLAIGYPPGQEEGNLKLIRKYKVGFVEQDPKKAAGLIKKLNQNPDRLKQLRPNLQNLARAHQKSGQIIAAEISRFLKISV